MLTIRHDPHVGWHRIRRREAGTVGQRTSYQPGTFSYVELATPEPEAAKVFYGGLFGWQADDQPLPAEAGGGVYTTMRLGGDAVAGLTMQQPAQQAAGVPPYWLSYITVTEADASAERARELGGLVHAGPFDVMSVGRMAVITDPAGAAFAVWQAGDSIGATRVNDAGCLTSNELSTTDVVGAIDFYSGLFGWQVEEVDTGGGPRYWLINHVGAAEGRNGGMRELAPAQAGVRPHWMPYFTAVSTDGTVASTKELGGALVAGPLDIPAGRIAVLHDPQGAVFAVFEGAVDD
jgi:predicted enzyme related to lactoylglutathione lyase